MDESILNTAFKILKKYSLCDSCLGRQFALLGSHMTNEERGKAIKTLLFMRIIRGEEIDEELVKVLARSNFKPAIDYAIANSINFSVKRCYLCEGIMDEINTLAMKAITKLREYEFNTFIVGCILPAVILSKEDKLRMEFDLKYAESMKREINREVGKLIQEKLGKKVDFKDPEILVLVDLSKRDIVISPRPLLIYGRYRKLARWISQSLWLCKYCRGKGCNECNWKGKKYELSIQELLGSILLKKTKGTKFIIHAAGREDVDVRTLGNGRPFIMEIKDPKVINIDLKELEKELNFKLRGLLEVFNLRRARREEVALIKSLSEVRKKVYRALVFVKDEIDKEKVRKIEENLRNRVIRQRTPIRVLSRRPDKIRLKKVYSIKVIPLNKHLLKVEIVAQGGLYIKELISGDEGRTNPSIAGILGTTARCLRLDVIDVEE